MDYTIKKAEEKTIYICQDKDALRAYTRREMALSDYTSGMNFAREEGKKEIAKNALARGWEPQEVAEVTGLDLETIQNLAKN
jgi:predicted transposase/invertase (TIGR01784 family)